MWFRSVVKRESVSVVVSTARSKMTFGASLLQSGHNAVNPRLRRMRFLAEEFSKREKVAWVASQDRSQVTDHRRS